MHHLLEVWFHWVLTGGYVAVFWLMALESTVFPIPSEVVIPPAAIVAATQQGTGIAPRYCDGASTFSCRRTSWLARKFFCAAMRPAAFSLRACFR